MIMWESAPEGYWECVVDSFYGVVGLKRDRSGWVARIEGPATRYMSPVLYHTPHEAKAWVEQQLADLTRERSWSPLA